MIKVDNRQEDRWESERRRERGKEVNNVGDEETN